MTTAHLSLDTFTRSYVDAILWVGVLCFDEGCDDCGSHGDDFSVADIDEKSLAEIVADCRNFQEECAADIGYDAAQAGHDFYLTRNGHGAGFWDGDWAEDVGQRLTTASKPYGSQSLMMNGDTLTVING